jgi:hypothetical protein
MTAEQFDDLYWNHQPPEVRKLRLFTEQSEAMARDLAKQGFLIDVPIMVWGWRPFFTMDYRRMLGFQWCPSALMEPGCGVGAPPAGAFKVSIDPADYPPFADVAAQAASPVGAVSYFGFYLPSKSDPGMPEGSEVDEPRGHFRKIIVRTNPAAGPGHNPFNNEARDFPYWEKM